MHKIQYFPLNFSGVEVLSNQVKYKYLKIVC